MEAVRSGKPEGKEKDTLMFEASAERGMNMNHQEPVFYRDVDAKLKEIFSEHCNLSVNQFEEIKKRMIYMVATIQDNYPLGDVEEYAEELNTIFAFMVNTEELTLVEYNELCNFVNGMADEAKERAGGLTEEWNECAKRLPEEPGRYLVVVSGVHGFRKRQIADFFIKYTGNNRPGWLEMGEDGYHEVKNVTHWMELPALPEE